MVKQSTVRKEGQGTVGIDLEGILYATRSQLGNSLASQVAGVDIDAAINPYIYGRQYPYADIKRARERLVRAYLAFFPIEEHYGTKVAARWFVTPNALLSNRKPVEVFASEEGWRDAIESAVAFRAPGPTNRHEGYLLCWCGNSL